MMYKKKKMGITLMDAKGFPVAPRKIYASEGVKNPYDDVFDRVSKEQGVPKPILEALGRAESGFRRDTLGKSGERGIMQLMPSIVKEYGVNDPFDPYENVTAGAKLLKKHYADSGNWKTSIGYYNGGKKGFTENKDKLLKSRSKYYDQIYSAIDDYEKPKSGALTQNIHPSLADVTSYRKPVNPNMSVPGKETLFPVQRTTLPSLSKPIPKPQQKRIFSAGDGIDQEPVSSVGDWMKLYDNPDLATNLDFVSNLFKKQ